jgi:hypothetical protein
LGFNEVFMNPRRLRFLPVLPGNYFKSFSELQYSMPHVVKHRFTVILLLVSLLSAKAQIIPELTVGDHFRPYLSEQQKQYQIIKSRQEYTGQKIPQTSQELYPQVYKGPTIDDLAPITRTPADPANVFKNNLRIGFNPAVSRIPILPQSLFSNSGYQQNQMDQYEADKAANEAQKRYQQQVMEEAYKAFERPTVEYHLGLHNGKAVDRYVNAYTELESMLRGDREIDFLKATWLVESSHDKSLSWEEFSGMFQDAVQVIKQLMVQDKLSPKDNLARIMSIYKYMSDTTKVYVAAKEKTIVSKPMLYDFEDYAAKKDLTKIFVSKLLRTGTGQCMSLPMLFYLFAKAMGAEAYIAFAPDHSYINFKYNNGNWQNIELTGRMLTASDFYWRSGFIKTEQVKSGIYLKPITEKETISYLLTTLTLAYVKTFGADERVLEMALTAREYSPNSLTANMIVAGYHHDLFQNVLRQYAVYGLSEKEFNNDKEVQAIKRNKEISAKNLYQNLGWSKMPEWAYKQWLDGVNGLAIKKQHIVKKRQLEQQLHK